jgi:hypothetical protein
MALFRSEIMAFWKADPGTPVVDSQRRDGSGVISRYECDEEADVQDLPHPDGKNQGSSCLVLATGNLYKLGTDEGQGTNGWRKM